MTPKRIQRKRTKGWRMPPNSVYVGRGSRWGNPYDWRDYRIDYENTLSPVRRAKLAARDDFEAGVALGEPWARHLMPHLPELRGKNLCCWCSLDQPCHADVLLEIVNA